MGIVKRAAIAATAVTAMFFVTSPASAQFCVVGIMAKALYANFHDDRELTAKEAATCGILVDDKEVEKMKKAKEISKGKKKVARAARKAKKP